MSDLTLEVAGWFDAATAGDGAATAKLQAHFQALHPEPSDPGQPPPPVPGAQPGQQRQPPAGGAFVPPAPGVPPSPENYVVARASGVANAPELEAAFRGFAHQQQLTIDEAHALSGAFHEAAAAEALWPHLDEATLAAKVADVEAKLLAEPDGAELLSGAQALFRRLQHGHPALAEHLVEAGAGTSLAFVQELGRVARRLGR